MMTMAMAILMGMSVAVVVVVVDIRNIVHDGGRRGIEEESAVDGRNWIIIRSRIELCW